MQLYDHQQQILDEDPKITGLWWSCGIGKTLTAIRLVENSSNVNCLIVCPKSLKENWRREIEKWSLKSNALWSVVSKEEFKKNATSISGINSVVIDESHFFHGHKSQMHKTMIKFLGRIRPERLYLLTATPLLSTPYNVYAISSLLGDKPNWRTFTDLYFYRIKMGPRFIWQPKKGWQDDMIPLLRYYGSVRSADECLDLPPQIYQREDFSLTPEQKRAIKALDDDPICTAPIVKWTKVHQICGGTIKQYDKSIQYAKSEKTKRVLELAVEHNKLIVVCRYNAELAMLSEALEKAGIETKVLNGATKNRQELLDSFESKSHGVLLINAAVSEGYNLRGVNKMVFYSLSFSLKDRVQMEGRIHGGMRGIPGKSSIYIDLVVKDTIDEDVHDCIQKKTDFQVELYTP